MKIAGICFSQSGVNLFEKMQRVLDQYPEYFDSETEWYYKGKHIKPKKGSIVTELKEPLADWAEKRFSHTDVMVFIGSIGIAVRTIAPYIHDKRHDPAVISIDDRGRYIIPILSGHIGGANEAAFLLAEKMGSIPVITTATDVYHKFAVDVYAKKHDLVLSNMTYAKEVSAALLAGEPVGFYTHFPVKGKLPEGLVWSDKLDEAMEDNGERSDGISLGIYISPSYNRAYFDHTLWLIPKCLSVGIGCKKGTDEILIENLVKETMDSLCLYQEAITSVASIDLKKDEPGLLEFCNKYELPLHTYSAEELRAVDGIFSSSEFVEETTGVDNVCERAAVKDSNGTLLINKISREGVTVAIAMKDWRVEFV